MRKRTKVIITLTIFVGLMLIGYFSGSPDPEKPKTLTKNSALNFCYEQAEKCAQSVPAVENQLKIACLQVYQYSNNSPTDMMRFSTGMCQ